MRRATSYAQLLAMQKQRLNTLNLTQEQAVGDLAKSVASFLKDQTSGSLTPKETAGAFARGSAPGKGGIRRRKNRRVPKLPINAQSGRLNRAVIFRRGGKGVFYAGFASAAGGGIHTVRPGGTVKMVDRGLYGPNGAVTKFVAAGRKAYRDKYIRKARTA